MGSIAAMENGSKDRYFQEMRRNWFRKALKAVLLTKGMLRTLYSSSLAVSVPVWVTVVQKIEKLKETGSKFVKISAASLLREMTNNKFQV